MWFDLLDDGIISLTIGLELGIECFSVAYSTARITILESPVNYKISELLIYQ